MQKEAKKIEWYRKRVRELNKELFEERESGSSALSEVIDMTSAVIKAFVKTFGEKVTDPETKEVIGYRATVKRPELDSQALELKVQILEDGSYLFGAVTAERQKNGEEEKENV